MRCFQRLIFYFAFTEESILKLVSLKVRNLVSLPLEGKETAAGCRMRCRMRSIRQEIVPIFPLIRLISLATFPPGGRLTKFRTLSGINFKMLSSVKEK